MNDRDKAEILKNKDEYYSGLMRKISEESGHDAEIAHGQADALLVKIILDELNFDKTIDAFMSIKKYYA